MKLTASTRLLLIAFLTSILLVHAVPSFSAQVTQPANDINLEEVAPDQVDSLLSKLTDEQVRSLLITELSKKIPSGTGEEQTGSGLFSFAVKWLHFFDIENEQEVENRLKRIFAHKGQVLRDLVNIFYKFGDGTTIGSASKNVCIVLAILLAAFAIEFFIKTLTANFRRQFLSQAVPELNGYMRFWAGIMHEIPEIMHVVIFTCASLLLFFVMPLSGHQSMRFLFMALLFSILFVRLGTLLSHLFCSPMLASLRLLPVNDAVAEKFHKVILLFLTYVGISMGFLALIVELGIPKEAFVLLVTGLGSILLLLTAIIIVQNRQSIANYILSGETVDSGSNWVINQFASLWHVPALMYLFMVWMIFIFQQTLGVRQDKGAFLLSLLVVPVFLILDRIGQWVVQMTVSTLKIYHVNETEENEGEKAQDELTPEQKERLLVVRVGRIIRLAILLALGGWVMSLWGYDIPYIATITKIVFRSLVTMALALAFWRVLSSYIERKILEEEPEEEDKEEGDDEWGSTSQRGRSYTLLPMVRKFIGTVLVVMVTLIVLSTIGIEIGPLLAGAGVVGLAIGFGAQKLVSDIFSGFFYLLDDAFRVGEYLEAGGVSGAVEGITLRNVMLRHHRGMLQIVPYSELGPITNYMRGGIVVKFNLEFPYDTDIDQVRKVIKKVGQAMLADEEFGKDFIKPVKSQGVREITSSVMVIRVKFTAKPGTHFVIRREAYRRITEALAAKGIHYAHRKVIVELPKDESGDQSQKQKLAEAGAAASLAAEEEQKKGE